MSGGLTYAATSAVGAWAERAALAYYETLGHTVYDFRRDKFLRSLDTDFIVDGIGWVEVKGDRHPPKNFYLERVSNNSKDTPGCVLYTAADFLFYYFVTVGTAYIIPAEALQAWAARRLTEFPQKLVRTARPNGAFAYDSFGHTVPVDTLLAEVAGITRLDELPCYS
jgi:hypothetical protein